MSLSRPVEMPLHLLLIAVFSVGFIIGIVAGVSAYSYGFNKAQDEARLERAADPKPFKPVICPPEPLQPAQNG